MGLAKNLELPSKIKNEILSDCGELQNANSWPKTQVIK
jgi:hypothetical protein